LDAHLFLIQSLETGRLQKRWRERIERANRRIANEIWVSHSSKVGTNWAGPSYFSGDFAPASLGPSAVLYGDSPAGVELSSGIGLGGKWVAVPSRVSKDTR
jgi:hypothetical protein